MTGLLILVPVSAVVGGVIGNYLFPRPTHCKCGCERSAHEHYRAGEDCGTCGRQVCPRFRGARR